MAFTVNDMLESIRSSRRHFLKHLRGLQPEQWDWKPYPECKSIRETLEHMVVVDLEGLLHLQIQGRGDFDPARAEARALCQVKEREDLIPVLEETHQRLCNFISASFGDAPLDTPMIIWDTPTTLGGALLMYISEDYYHAGQVAFIRMATDPQWDYYGSIFSDGMF